MSVQTALAFYLGRIESIRQQEADIDRRSKNLTLWRGLTSLPAIGLAAYWWLSDAQGLWGYGLAGGLFVLFIGVVGVHERLLELAQLLAQRRVINQHHIDRLNRDWDRCPIPEVEIPSESIPLSRDLDLFGKSSLFQWLCVAQTALGVQQLRDWLLKPASPHEIASRQEAVQRLAGAQALREELQLRGRLLIANGKGPDKFLEWAESSPWLASRPILKWISRFISLAMLGALITGALGGPALSCLIVIAILAIANIGISLRYVPNIHDLFEVVASRQNDVLQYRRALSLLKELPGDCEKFQELRAKLGRDVDEPFRCLDNLGLRVKLAMARHSALWGLPYLVFQWLFLWDVHVLAVIESWQRRNGFKARQWFEALAELEALSSLATVAHDQSEWAFPQVVPECASFNGQQLGHPLLSEQERVVNDVQIGPAGTFLLVSGSNMSGKSTLLRSVGVNAILAQAGGPCCATACRLPPSQVATSMRIGDSLADGVSFYMAELKRLKQIVDLADVRRSETGPVLLYLLDEILLGTNSAERHIAVMRVIRHLLDARAIGAVSTHDLELATSPEIATECRPVHFREEIIEQNGKSEMTFDYRMRQGVATTTNALKLLEMVGLG